MAYLFPPYLDLINPKYVLNLIKSFLLKKKQHLLLQLIS